MKVTVTPIAKVTFEESNRIIHIKVREGAEMTLKNTEMHYRKINELVGDKKYFALVDASHFYSIEEVAWKYASSREVFSNRVAIAHYNVSLPNKLVTNFFKKRFNSALPLEIFETEEEARQWLKSIPA